MATSPVPMSEQSGNPTVDNQHVSAMNAFLQFVKNKFAGSAPTAGGSNANLGQPTPGVQGGPPPQMTAPPPGGLAPTLSTPQPVGIAPRPQPPQSSAPDWAPNKSAMQGAVTTSAVDGIAKAITDFKTKRDSDNISKAQNTLNMFQNAMQQGDMQVAELLSKDPKIVKSWEKYLKMEFPRLPGGDPSKPAGVNQPGGIAVTRNINADAAAQLAARKQQADIGNVESQTTSHLADAGLATAQAAQAAATTAAAQHKLEIDQRYDDAKAKAGLAESEATTQAALAKAAGDAAYAKAFPDITKAQIRNYNASAAESIARSHVLEHEAAAGGTPAELRANFTEARRDYGATLVSATKDLNTLKTFYNKINGNNMTASAGRAMGAAVGLMDSKASVKTQLDTAQANYDKMMKGFMWMAKQEEDVAGGKTKASDVLTKAYEMGGLGPSTASAPAVGSVVDGFKFNGGDPSDQKNWTAVASGKK